MTTLLQRIIRAAVGGDVSGKHRNIRPISEIPDRFPKEKRKAQKPPRYVRTLTYTDTHLPVTPSKIQAAINNPHATYDDMDALWFSANNSSDPDAWDMLDAISKRRAELIYKK